MKILRSVTQVDRRFVVHEFLILTIMDRFLLDKYEKLNHCYFSTERVVGWCEGAVYLRSPGRPTDIGLQLGKACYPYSG